MADNKNKRRDPKRQAVRDQLLRNHPFLRVQYRELFKKDLGSPKVFKELFPKVKNATEAQINFMLKAVYEFQK